MRAYATIAGIKIESVPGNRRMMTYCLVHL
jgi:hypothetical protein